MKKNYALSAILAVALVICLGFTVASLTKANEYKNYIRYTNEKSFSQLVDSVNSLNAALQKGMYAGSGAVLATQSAQIWREAMLAKSALASLEVNDPTMEKLHTFIAQVGGYSYDCLKTAAGGEPLSDEAQSNLTALAKVSNGIAYNLTQTKDKVNDGSLDLHEAFQIDRLVSQKSGESGDGIQATAGQSDQKATDFPQYPTLIYDGPFSAHLDKLEPLLLKGEKELSQEETLKKAHDFLELPTGSLTFQGENNGKITAHTHGSEKGDISINLSKNGGYVIDMLNARQTGKETLSISQAIQKAKTILAKKGYENMEESYFAKFDGKYVINFAPKIDGVLYYPDLVKVGIFADDGSLASFESRGYIMSHSKRDIDKTSLISKEAAQKSVSRHLTVISHQLAMIPTEGKNEILCHEFVCKNQEGQEYIVYINGKTGTEQSIFLLVKDEKGALTY